MIRLAAVKTRNNSKKAGGHQTAFYFLFDLLQPGVEFFSRWLLVHDTPPTYDYAPHDTRSTKSPTARYIYVLMAQPACFAGPIHVIHKAGHQRCQFTGPGSRLGTMTRSCAPSYSAVSVSSSMPRVSRLPKG